jgi:2-methylisocitrate lyase-like PEP mutase family enzyme
MTFRDLHYDEQPLLLPNAWDVPSALAFRDLGFAAIGTTSFGVAVTSGRADGNRSTAEANVGLAGALSRLGCYVSVDIEDGYADEPDRVADYTARLPAAGINIEDSTAERLIDPRTHAAKVRAVKDRCPELFVNARVDTYSLNQDATVHATIGRAEQYVDAGADGIFVPGASDPEVLRELASHIPRPLNVLAIPGRTLTELADCGVRRVSTGSLPYRAAMWAATAAVLAVRDGQLPPAATPYADLQARLADYERSPYGTILPPRLP